MPEKTFNENSEDLEYWSSGNLAKLYVIESGTESKGYLNDKFVFPPREILYFDFNFNQAVDSSNLPCGIPRGGKVKLKLKGLQEEINSDFISWMLHRKKYNCYIQIISPSELSKTLSKVELFDSYCVDYKRVWEDKVEDSKNSAKLFQNSSGVVLDEMRFGTKSTHKATLQEEISIVWKEMRVDGVTFTNDWL